MNRPLAAILLSIGLAGCSSLPTMPDWLSSLPHRLFASAAKNGAADPPATGIGDIPAKPVAGIAVHDIRLPLFLRALLAGTGLKPEIAPAAAHLRVSAESGSTTLDRALASLGGKYGLSLAIEDRTLRVGLKTAGWDPAPCASEMKIDARTETASVYAIPLDIRGEPISDACAPTGETAPVTFETMVVRDEQGLPASLLKIVPKAKASGHVIRGKPFYRVQPWRLAAERPAPARSQSWYEGCTLSTPVILRQTWERPDGTTVERAGPAITVERTRSCADSPIVRRFAQNRSDTVTSFACVKGRIRTSRQELSEVRTVLVTERGERRPGPWRTVASLPIAPPSAKVPCDPARFTTPGQTAAAS